VLEIGLHSAWHALGSESLHLYLYVHACISSGLESSQVCGAWGGMSVGRGIWGGIQGAPKRAMTENIRGISSAILKQTSTVWPDVGVRNAIWDSLKVA
jgi:hypothetical protein